MKKWIELGFEKKIADRIANYRYKGGKFRKKEDLLKIYGINQKLVKAYFDYIIISPEPKKERSNISVKEAVEKVVAKDRIVKEDLNLSHANQLKNVRGIGPVLSSRIIKYREALGGFVHHEQLKEVYGIDHKTYLEILRHFDIVSKTVEKININQDTIKVIARHPYISYKTSRAIIKYRVQHGDYQSIDQIKKIHTISDSLYYKIAPYLTINPTE